jgi:hypothetical protein
MHDCQFHALVNRESSGLERNTWLIPAGVCTEARKLRIRSAAGGGLGDFGPASE